MSKLPFLLAQRHMVAGRSIAYDESLGALETLIPGAGDRSIRGRLVNAALKPFFYSLLSWRNRWLVDGFICGEAGRLVKKHLNEGSTFVDIGCGDMRFRRFLPKGLCYNAFDIRIPAHHLWRQRRMSGDANIAIASVHNIPLPDASVSIGVCLEVFHQVPNIEKAIAEIYRVLKKDGLFIVSLCNRFCYKYQKKGPNALTINQWTFDEFPPFMTNFGFSLLEKKMFGLWVPLPRWLTEISYQLPYSHPKEFYNTTFLYAFTK
jgi:SAM-dependent methyltransferase